MTRIVAPVLALALIASPAAPQQGDMVVGDVPIHYEIQGDGPPVVLIHGWTHNLHSWDFQLPTLVLERTVLRYDRRGFGQSGGAADPTMDPADLDALMDGLGLESATVVGHSQGAAVALAFALAYPDRVDALVLYGSPPPEGFGLPWTGPDALTPEMLAIAPEHGLDSLGAVLMSHPLARGFEPGHPGSALVMRLWESYSGGDLLDPRPPSGTVPPPHVDRLVEVDAPTLVMTGEWEMPYFRIVADALAYGIPGARRSTVEGGGHAVHMQEPARFTAELLRFLRSLER